jgi:hypothetical protein
MKFESPWHRDFLLTRQIYEVSNNLIDIGFGALSLDGYLVTIVTFNWFFFDISAAGFSLISHTNFFKSDISVIKLVSNEDRGVEGNGHVQELERAVREELEDEAFGEFFRNLNSESAIGSSRRLDCSRDITSGIDVLEDHINSKADVGFHVTE